MGGKRDAGMANEPEGVPSVVSDMVGRDRARKISYLFLFYVDPTVSFAVFISLHGIIFFIPGKQKWGNCFCEKRKH